MKTTADLLGALELHLIGGGWVTVSSKYGETVSELRADELRRILRLARRGRQVEGAEKKSRREAITQYGSLAGCASCGQAIHSDSPAAPLCQTCHPDF